MNNNYKVFGDYLLELLKIIVFGALLVWACSCNNRADRAVDLIHAYTDTILRARWQAAVMQQRIDSIRADYSKSFPITRFTPAQYKERMKFVVEEDSAYLRMSRACTDYQIQKILFLSKCDTYKRKIDSLQVELYR